MYTDVHKVFYDDAVRQKDKGNAQVIIGQFLSHLDAPDTPEKQEDTRRLWKAVQSGEYEVLISPVVVRELLNCPEPKQSMLYGKPQNHIWRKECECFGWIQRNANILTYNTC